MTRTPDQEKVEVAARLSSEAPAFETSAPAEVPPVDDLDRSSRRRSAVLWTMALIVLLVASMMVAAGIGAVGVSPSAVAQIFGNHLFGLGHVSSFDDDAIIWRVRAPRVVLAAIVGAGLSIVGVATQALVRNVLADPYLLGVSDGAATGATAAILLGVGASLGASAISFTAFIGAALATAVVFAIARIGGRVTPIRLVIAGVAVGYGLSAVTSFLIITSGSRGGAQAVVFWLLGSLSLTDWSNVPVPAAAVSFTLLVLLFWARRLDAIAIGDDTALTLGVNPTRFRTQVFLLVALCIGAVVAVSGMIGFVGLVIPHVTRRLVGGEHRKVLIASALLGATFLIWADVIARVVLRPQEIPIGVVTAALGAPFLLALVRRFHSAST